MKGLNNMIKIGEAPFLECSSKGDKRFSAFYARPKSLAGYSIEHAYQAAKVFSDGSTNLTIKEAKGRYSVNQEEVEKFYTKWWEEWIDQENLLPVLKNVSGLSDIFGQKNHVCQVLTLWVIRSR